MVLAKGGVTPPLSEADLCVFANYCHNQGLKHGTLGVYVSSVCKMHYEMGWGLIDRGKHGCRMPRLRDVIKSFKMTDERVKVLQEKDPKPRKGPKRLLLPSDQARWRDVLDFEETDTMMVAAHAGQSTLGALRMTAWSAAETAAVALRRKKSSSSNLRPAVVASEESTSFSTLTSKQ